MFVADGLGIVLRRDLRIEPSSSVFSARFSGQGHAPFAKAIFEFPFLKSREVPNLLDAQRMQMRFHHFADTRNFMHIERRNESRLFPRQNPENAIRLVLP